MRKRDGSTYRVGFVIFVASLIAVGGVLLIGSESLIFGGKVRYFARFPRISLLRTGAPVYLAGVRVGTVSDLRFAEDPADTRIVVELGVEHRFRHRIRENVVCEIRTEGLLGDKIICLAPEGEAPPGRPIRPGGEIPARPPTDVGELIAGGREVVTSTSGLIRLGMRVLERIDRGEGTIGKLIADPTLYENLVRVNEPVGEVAKRASAVLADLEAILADLRAGRGTFGKLLQTEAISDAVLADLHAASQTFAEEVRALREEAGETFRGAREAVDRVASRLDGVLEKAETGEGTVAMLLRDGALYGDLRGAARELRGAAERIGLGAEAFGGLARDAREGEGAIPRLVRDPEVGRRVARAVASVEASAQRLESILAKIDGNRGSLGMLVNDPALAVGLRDVVEGIQQSGLLRRAIRSAERTGRERRIARVLRARFEEAPASREGPPEPEGGAKTGPRPAASGEEGA